MIFQRGEYTKPMAFDGFWNVFLLLLKIKRPGSLFGQTRYLHFVVAPFPSTKRVIMHYWICIELRRFYCFVDLSYRRLFLIYKFLDFLHYFDFIILSVVIDLKFCILKCAAMLTWLMRRINKEILHWRIPARLSDFTVTLKGWNHA